MAKIYAIDKMLEMGRILKSKPSPLRVKIKTIVYRLSPALTEYELPAIYTISLYLGV